MSLYFNMAADYLGWILELSGNSFDCFVPGDKESIDLKVKYWDRSFDYFVAGGAIKGKIELASFESTEKYENYQQQLCQKLYGNTLPSGALERIRRTYLSYRNAFEAQKREYIKPTLFFDPFEIGEPLGFTQEMSKLLWKVYEPIGVERSDLFKRKIEPFVSARGRLTSDEVSPKDFNRIYSLQWKFSDKNIVPGIMHWHNTVSYTNKPYMIIGVNLYDLDVEALANSLENCLKS
jgi:hypothetical protein